MSRSGFASLPSSINLKFISTPTQSRPYSSVRNLIVSPRPQPTSRILSPFLKPAASAALLVISKFPGLSICTSCLIYFLYMLLYAQNGISLSSSVNCTTLHLFSLSASRLERSIKAIPDTVNIFDL